MKNPRSKHSPAFKAKVALEAVREQDTVAEIARRHKLNANMVYKWRQQLLQNLACLFESEGASGSNGLSPEREAELLQKIGQLTIERDFLRLSHLTRRAFFRPVARKHSEIPARR